MTLDRRDFVLQSVRFGSALGVGATLLPAVGCDMGGNPPIEGELGEFGNPYTRDNPGEWSDKIEIHQPILYAAPVDNALTRLWIEIQDISDPQNPKTHEQTLEHYVDRVTVTDEFGNIIGDATFSYTATARLVTSVTIPDGVATIYCYEHCNLHGWWRSVYNVADIPAEPAGDLRRPFTVGAPGRWADKVPVHIPYIGYAAADGAITVEVGSREDGTLHEMVPDHYIDRILIFNQYGQLQESAVLSPDNYAEPSIRLQNIPQIQGSDFWRIVASCNLHDWWEAVYTTR